VPVVSGANCLRPKLVNTEKQVLNLASYSFTGLAGNETFKMRAIKTFRKYVIGSCGTPGLYGTIGASVFSQFPAVMNGFVFQTSACSLVH
jgi:serine palmitoyltransferase